MILNQCHLYTLYSTIVEPKLIYLHDIALLIYSHIITDQCYSDNVDFIMYT